MNRIILPLLAIAMLAACSSPKEKALQHIKGLEASDSIFSPKTIADQKAAYLDFANKYPDDEQSPEFLFKAAQRCNAVADHKEAIAIFQHIVEKYPKNKVSEESLFLQGYIYENSIQDYAKARDTYAQFIQKYPDSELAEDARLAIENLGKSPEEIFKGFSSKKDSAA